MADLLLTRPRAASERFIHDLRGLAGGPFRAEVSPLMEPITLGRLPDIRLFDGLIFSSAQGVRSYAALDGVPNVRCRCVGARTAEAAKKHGLTVQDVYLTADAMVEAGSVAGKWLHVRGVHTRGDLRKRLTTGNGVVQEAVVYDQKARPLTVQARTLLQSPRVTIVPLFSPRSAALFRAQAEGISLQKVKIVALSEAVAVEMQGFGESLSITAQPTGDSMLAMVAKLLFGPMSG